MITIKDVIAFMSIFEREEIVMKKNMKVRVVSDHKFHPNRIGYFQFIAKNDTYVLAEDANSNPQTLFAVGKNDIVPCE